MLNGGVTPAAERKRQVIQVTEMQGGVLSEEFEIPSQFDVRDLDPR